MKHLLFFLSTLFFAFQLSAQKSLQLLGMKVKHIGVSFGEDKDMLHNMDYSYLIGTARGNTSAYDGMDFGKQDVESMLCENPHVRVEVSLLPPLMKNTELRLALVGIFNRVDYMSYYKGEWDSPEGYESLSVYSTANEMALETSFLKHSNRQRSLSWYGGIGQNFGFAYTGYVNVNYEHSGGVIATQGEGEDSPVTYETIEATSTWQDYNLRNGVHQRLFLHGGFGYRFFKRVEIGMECRWGIGYRATFGSPVKMTELRSYGLTARWLMK